MSLAYCSGCFEKQQKMDRLLEENQRLKAQLRYRKEKEGFFGSSTPSSRCRSSPTPPRKRRKTKEGPNPDIPGLAERSSTNPRPSACWRWKGRPAQCARTAAAP